MRGMVIREYGRPLEPEELPSPQVRPGHALLEVLTCGVCFSDVKTSRGKMPFSADLRLPHVPGHEICARVLETDPRDAIAPGTIVVVYHVWPCGTCDRCRAGDENICRHPRAWAGFTHPGGFQERLVAPLDRLVRVPPNVNPVQAAPLTCALGTAYRSVVTRGRVAPGTRVAVIGLGGVGIHALQVARVAGAHVVGLDISDPAIATARELGLDARQADAPGVEDELLSEFGGEGVDVVVDTVGNEVSLRRAEHLVRPGGRIVVVGYAVDGRLAVPAARFVLEEVELIGSRYVRRDELERAIRLVADGHVRMVVDRVTPLEDANDAIAALDAHAIVGRVVLDVAGVA
jgi:D-arabinose 1-dehydrogenase-like Zn-dependent alcohol dehydrogenase